MKALPKKPAKPINVIDIEASGFGRDSYPIEIGIVLADGTQYQTLVRPDSRWWHWDRAAQEVHGISRSDLFKYGRPIAQVCSELNEICAGAALYSDCWVHDSYWYRRLFDSVNTQALGQCKAMEYLLSDDQHQVYQMVKRQVASRLGLSTHRALNDAVIIQEALQQLMTHWVDSDDSVEIRQFANASGSNPYANLRLA